MSTFRYLIEQPAASMRLKRPDPPLGPAFLEIVRSCALRACFEVTPGFERRLDFAARVGIAFHRTIQSFWEKPLPSDSPDAVAQAARTRFMHEVQVQKHEAAQRPRERGLPQKQQRIDRAAEAVIVEALRFVEASGRSLGFPKGDDFSHSTLIDTEGKGAVLNGKNAVEIEVEVPVESNDGLLRGRIDRVEYQADGVHLYDYKSALRDDLPGRYERQLQLYACMWYDTKGTWPSKAEVMYPLAGRNHEVCIDPAVCRQVAGDAVSLVTSVQKQTAWEALATPGDTCQVCDFRPWCQPFWIWQARAKKPTDALESAALGLEGRIASIHLSDYYWNASIAWQSATVVLVAPKERFPHLTNARQGTAIRVLDIALRGMRSRPRAMINEYSEIFLLA